MCPGRKFSQVQFVAVVAFLFRRHRVRPALFKGESVEEGKRRVLRTVKDSKVVMLLQMMDPTIVSLIWTEKVG